MASTSSSSTHLLSLRPASERKGQKPLGIAALSLMLVVVVTGTAGRLDSQQRPRIVAGGPGAAAAQPMAETAARAQPPPRQPVGALAVYEITVDGPEIDAPAVARCSIRSVPGISSAGETASPTAPIYVYQEDLYTVVTALCGSITVERSPGATAHAAGDETPSGVPAALDQHERHVNLHWSNGWTER